MYNILIVTVICFILMNTIWCSRVNNGKTVEIKACKQIGFIFGGIMFFLSAFRDGVGFDFYNYKNLFEYINYSNLHVFELFYELKTDLSFVCLSKLLPCFSFVIVIYAVVGVLLKIYIIRKYSPYVLLSMLVYFMTDFINFDMGAIRQGAAISLFWMMLYFLWTKRIELAILTICISIFVHSSSILYFLFLLFYNCRLSIRHVVVISIISVIIFFLFRDVVEYLFQIIGIEFFKEKYNFYLNYETRDLFVSFAKRFLLLLVFTIAITANKRVDDFKTRIIYNAYVFGIVIFSVMSAVPTFAGRGSAAFYSVYIFLIAETCTSIRSQLIRACFVFVVLIMSYISMDTLIEFGQNTDQLYIPYKTIFE